MSTSEAKLIGIRCQKCNRLMSPPVYSCLTCGGTNFREEELSGIGQIYSVVSAQFPALGFEDLAPYFLAAVQIEDKLLLTARIEVEEGKTPKIGDRVILASVDERKYVFKVID